MRKMLLAFAVLSLWPGLSNAVEVKNLRPCYAVLGATRTDLKLLPGDLLFMTYDVEGLVVDPKTGKVNYIATLEMVDSSGKSLFKKETPTDGAIPQFGGNRMPGELHVILSTKQAPGKYWVRLTVTDRNGKETKAVTFPFEVIPEGFGLVFVEAPGIGFPGQPYIVRFMVLNMTLDSKKRPDVTVALRILDDAGKSVSSPIYFYAPKDVPETIDLTKENLVPVSFPLVANRPGRFTVEIAANDKVGKHITRISYPLTIIDVKALTVVGR